MDITKNTINMIKDKKYEDAIEYLYTHIDDLVGSIGTKLYDYSEKKYLELINNNSTDIAAIFRLTVFHLLNNLNNIIIDDEVTNIKYTVLVGKNALMNKLFVLSIITFYQESVFRKTYYTDAQRLSHVGIDYEFNNRQIALMQLCMNDIIWVVNPRDFEPKTLDLAIRYLFTAPTIYKILHGSDSLDIPYMYSELFGGNKDIIFKFTNKLIDTRFLCEYFKVVSLSQDKKCSLYDAMFFFKTINEAKHKELTAINESVGPIQDVSWDVKKISTFQLKYALYDVIYLKKFLFDIYRSVIETKPDYILTFKYINYIIRFVFLERRNVTNVLDMSKKIIDPVNNYYVVRGSSNMTLISIYGSLLENYKLIINKSFVDISFILSVNYFRNTFSILLKAVIYYVVIMNYTVHKNKTETVNRKDYTLNNIKSELKNDQQDKILKLIEMIEKDVKAKIIHLS
jgi:hypothetical protein